MGNLGRYQDITTAAKGAGGVDKLISTIEKLAVDNAALKLRAQGVGLGVTGALVVGGAVAAASRRFRGAKKVREARAQEAKAQLRAEVQESTGPHDA